jgi:hypothetical protein
MTPLEILLRAAGHHYNPDSNPWDPPLRSYFPAAQHRPVRGPMQNTLAVDGPPRHPILGGGRPQHPFLPIYKTRPPRRS